MSTYTTGEIAKLTGVTVRTVQYYDTRGILKPTALSEGGRRLYSQGDLKRLRTICFLRELGLPINAIGQILAEESPDGILEMLIDQRMTELREEMAENRRRLDALSELRREIKSADEFSVESIGDIAHQMEDRRKLNRLHFTLLMVGIPVSALQWATIFIWIFKGIWWPFALWVPLAAAADVPTVKYYLRHTAYVCPQCHETFKPSFAKFFWARHTPRTRKLTCTHCGYNGFCMEVWRGEEK